MASPRDQPLFPSFAVRSLPKLPWRATILQGLKACSCGDDQEGERQQLSESFKLA